VTIPIHKDSWQKYFLAAFKKLDDNREGYPGVVVKAAEVADLMAAAETERLFPAGYSYNTSSED
jgi:hypothetical protein